VADATGKTKHSDEDVPLSDANTLATSIRTERQHEGVACTCALDRMKGMSIRRVGVLFVTAERTSHSDEYVPPSDANTQTMFYTPLERILAMSGGVFPYLRTCSRNKEAYSTG
jgi:hypothetical protein